MFFFSFCLSLKQAASPWLYVVPYGIREVINWVSLRYGNPPIYVTENGRDQIYDPNDPISETIEDPLRIAYYQEYLDNVRVCDVIFWPHFSSEGTRSNLQCY